MTKPFEHGLDLERAKAFPVCAACRMKFDSVEPTYDGTWLCGRHLDEFITLRHISPGLTPASFAKAQRETKYLRCWAAEEM